MKRKLLKLIVFKLVGLCLSGTAWADGKVEINAIQRPQEKSRVSRGVSRRASRTVAAVRSSAAYSRPCETYRGCATLEDSKPRKICSAITTQEQSNRVAKAHDIGRISAVTSKPAESMRSLRGVVHGEESTRFRPLPPHESKSRATACHLQLRYRVPEGLSPAVYSSSEVSSKVESFACAVAKAEGWSTPGTIPYRYRNPGDLKVRRGERYPGQVGIGKANHVIFRSDAAGWAALYHQIDKALAGESKFYQQDMTLAQVAKKYAANSRLWARNVAHNLGVTPDTTLQEYFDLAPTVRFSCNIRTTALYPLMAQ